jgi:sterol desaturase/sphingolipid hydroxylase (fatty acid hydroxylase superfamily)
MALDGWGDLKAVLFPPILISFFFTLFAVPVGALLAWLFSANVAYLFVITALGYFLNYEVLHLLYHLPQSNPLARLPLVPTLRRLHHTHHHPELMTKRNFNITYPIGDWVFRTLA